MTSDFQIVLPEVIIAVCAMAALMFGVTTGKDKTASLLVWITSGLFVLMAVWIGAGGDGVRSAFGGMFIDDPFARFAKVTILLSAAAVLAMGRDYMQRRDLLRFEYPVLVALATVGMMLMVSAGDLMTLYMGLELQSLALYVIAALRRDSVKSTEAGLKYFMLGALSSGMLLYGASLVYGFAGTTLFSGILSTLSGEVPLGLLFGLVFVLSGLAFKISAAPFHMWTPDVYEGAPTPVTAFLATAPKVAAMRLMAYSSISHMGFALMGLASGTAGGVQAMLIYMAIYVTMNIGTFAFILSMEKDGRPVTSIDSLNMYSRREPLRALALLVLMFSLAGVPPTVGFFGKLYVLKAAVDGGMAWLAVLGVVASVIGAFYYLRIVYYMYFGKDGDRLDGPMPAVQWVLLVGSAAVMLIGIVNLFGIEATAAVAAQTLVR